MRRSTKWIILRRLTILLSLTGLFSLWWTGYLAHLAREWLSTNNGVKIVGVTASSVKQLHEDQLKYFRDRIEEVAPWTGYGTADKVEITALSQAVGSGKIRTESRDGNAKHDSTTLTMPAIATTMSLSEPKEAEPPTNMQTTVGLSMEQQTSGNSSTRTEHSALHGLCRGGRGAAAFLVVSAVSREATAQRAAVLSSWGAELHRHHRLAFFAPVAPGEATQASKLSVQGDLLTLAIPAGQNRILTGLVWLRARCPKVRAIVLTSDRSFWNVRRLEEFLNSHQFDSKAKAIYGRWPKPAMKTKLAAQAGFILPGPAVDALKRAAIVATNDGTLSENIPVVGPLMELGGVRQVQLQGDELLQASSDRPIRISQLACQILNQRLMAIHGLGVGHTLRLWRLLSSAGLKCFRERKKKHRRNW